MRTHSPPLTGVEALEDGEPVLLRGWMDSVTPITGWTDRLAWRIWVVELQVVEVFPLQLSAVTGSRSMISASVLTLMCTCEVVASPVATDRGDSRDTMTMMRHRGIVGDALNVVTCP